VWLLPDGSDAVEVSKFRAAVVQHVICLGVRRQKNAMGLVQQYLADSDDRADGVSKWNARLGGRIPLTMQDYATLLRILPRALPDSWELEEFLDVVEGRRAPSETWEYPDYGIPSTAHVAAD
jgi:hypothetical protein